MRCMGLSIARSVCKEVARASVGGASAEGGEVCAVAFCTGREGNDSMFGV